MTRERDDDIFAAELALGVLERAERAEAEARVAADAAFAAAVDRWRARLLPMLGAEAAPTAELWERIAPKLAANDAPNAPADAVALRRWRAFSFVASAVAAVLALVLILQPGRTPPVVPPQPVETQAPRMVAALEGDEIPMAVAIGIEKAGAELLITPVRMADDDRARELWVIPADGTPRSLGLIAGDAPSRMNVAPPMRTYLSEGATLAISLEPAGGSPTGAPTGPVVATGKLLTV